MSNSVPTPPPPTAAISPTVPLGAAETQQSTVVITPNSSVRPYAPTASINSSPPAKAVQVSISTAHASNQLPQNNLQANTHVSPPVIMAPATGPMMSGVVGRDMRLPSLGLHRFPQDALFEVLKIGIIVLKHGEKLN
jgi:hypothetical protein